MCDIKLIGSIHHDPKGEERLKKAVDIFDFDVVFIEGVEDWTRFKKGMEKIKKEVEKEASDLPKEDREKIMKRLEGKKKSTIEKNKGYEYKIKQMVNSPVLYLDDESYIDRELDRKKDLFFHIIENYRSVEKDSSKENRKRVFVNNYIMLFLFKHPEATYEIFSEGKTKTNLKKIVMEDLEKFFNVEEHNEKIAEKIITRMNIEEGVEEFYKNKSYRRDKNWKKKIDKYKKDNPNSFYSLLSKDYDVERYSLKEVDKL